MIPRPSLRQDLLEGLAVHSGSILGSELAMQLAFDSMAVMGALSPEEERADPLVLISSMCKRTAIHC